MPCPKNLRHKVTHQTYGHFRKLKIWAKLALGPGVFRVHRSKSLREKTLPNNRPCPGARIGLS